MSLKSIAHDAFLRRIRWHSIEENIETVTILPNDH